MAAGRWLFFNGTWWLLAWTILKCKITLSFSIMLRKFTACCGLGIALFEVAIAAGLIGNDFEMIQGLRQARPVQRTMRTS